jgi:hypothetical protein
VPGVCPDGDLFVVFLPNISPPVGMDANAVLVAYATKTTLRSVHTYLEGRRRYSSCCG